jgi:hypothetical protein
MRSPSGWPEVPCARCGTRVPGLAWGERCAACQGELSRRASRLARRISFPTTLLVALYVTYRLPPLDLARFYGVLAVLVTYIVVHKVVHRVALEVLSR